MEYTISICDDEQFFVDDVKSLINNLARNRNLNIRIYTYTSGRKMITDMNRHIPDIILLDINMPDANGIDIAHTIRETNSSVPIIFISGHPDYVFQSFDVKAYSFIKKTDWETKLPIILIQAIAELHKHENEFITLIHDYSATKIAISSIVYAYLDNRHINICLSDNRIMTISCTMNSFIKLLNSSDFILVYSGCLVNMNYITNIQKTLATLQNGKEIPIARSRAAQVKQHFLEHTSRKGFPS